MEGKLIHDHGKDVCVSCFNFNCWHSRGKPCDIRGCECTVGHKA